MPHAAVAPKQRGRAKSLRQRMTRAETLLWRYIKADRVDGLGFRRQVPMQQYVADFICHAAHLVIEIDGESHDFVSRQRSDAARDRWFKSQGYKVLRFTNEEVLTNLEGVVETIRAEGGRAAPPSLSLPHKGGGNAQTAAEPRAVPSLTLPRKRGREQAGARGKCAP
ncbi:MAG TPA: endonuclease domain-containing protein [Pseudolabrys sp.]|nr:endonuclease domain-containing protein [Pseudolabrys sp.]